MGYGKLFACFVLSAAFVATSCAPAVSICETAACKTYSDELQHRSMNLNANPCDDFYEYVCGSWEKNHPLNDHSSRENAFTIRNHQVQHEINDAIKAAAATGSHSHAAQYLAQLYLECNNTDSQESRGVKPLADMIDQLVGGWPMLKKTHTPHGQHWSKLFTQVFSHTGLSPIFRITVQYERHLHKKFIFVAPGGTGISPDNLLNPTTHHKAIDAYKAYIRSSAIAMGATDNEKLTEDIEKMVHLETNIAKVLRQSPFNMIRIGTFSGLNTATNHRIDWVATVNSILTATKSGLAHFRPEDKLGAVNLEFLHGAAAVLDETNEEVVQNLFAWLMVAVFGPLTTHKFRHNEATYKATLTGIKNELPTPEYCFNIANSKLPFAMGRIYVDSHFTPEDKKEAQVLIKEVKASFKKVLETNTWLDEQTRELALEKLAAIKENVAYPDWVMSNQDLDTYYSHMKNVEVQKGHFMESAVQLNTLTVRHGFDTLNEPINHTLMWPMTPATVNAAYMPAENSITIPAAVLKSPFFDKSRPYSMNYGAIGAIIGHELTHGFDHMGRRFDLHGQEKNWWTQETLTEFNHRAQCFVKQYGAVVDPLAQLHINGQLTLGENIADNGGVKEAFNAFHNHEAKSTKSQVLPGLKLNADQLFFVSYARNWCSVMRKEMLQMLIRTNPHPPDRYRVNVVLGNSEQFSKTFNCPSGSKMNPVQKCAVW